MPQPGVLPLDHCKLLGEWVWTTCPRLLPDSMAWQGFEPATIESQVECCTTKLSSDLSLRNFENPFGYIIKWLCCLLSIHCFMVCLPLLSTDNLTAEFTAVLSVDNYLIVYFSLKAVCDVVWISFTVGWVFWWTWRYLCWPHTTRFLRATNVEVLFAIWQS